MLADGRLVWALVLNQHKVPQRGGRRDIAETASARNILTYGIQPGSSDACLIQLSMRP